MPAQKSTARKKASKRSKAAAARRGRKDRKSRRKPEGATLLTRWNHPHSPSLQESPVYEMRDARAVDAGESDAELFDEARSQWLTGDWDALAGWHLSEFANHPKRVRIALLVAAALHEVRDYDSSKEALRQAIEWGARRRDLVNVVVGQTHAALGRARLAAKEFDRAELHFLACITSIAPNKSAARYAKDRAFKEAVALGLLPDARQLLEKEAEGLSTLKFADEATLTSFSERLHALETVAASTKRSAPQPQMAEEASRQELQARALAFYSSLGEITDGSKIPFLLIDSKSIPRSGVHFLKKSLAKLFGDHFSFCEWYHEEGCCKSMPCALTSFATRANETGSLRIRLTKSHDFKLQDQIYPTGPHLRRLILVRQPLYVLTSWFALDQLDTHRSELAQQGINVTKIYLQHESDVIAAAFTCLDQCFKPPSISELEAWLQVRQKYCEGFISRWVEPLISRPCDFASVVSYENLLRYLRGLVTEFQGSLKSDDQSRIDAEMSRLEADFKPRPNPFITQSPKLTAYLQENKLIFSTVASHLSTLQAYKSATTLL